MSSLGAVLLALFVGSPAGDDVFVRDLKTVDDVVRAIHLRAEREKRTRLVVCLDDGLFEKKRWFDSISNEFKGQPFDVVITSRSEPTKRVTKVDADVAKADDSVTDLLAGVLDGATATRRNHTPVLEWTSSVLPFARRGAVVVFISSCGPVASWSAPKSDRELDDCLDSCWHEEEVGSHFASAGVSLWIVAPEATIGLDAAVTLFRFLPYANRPVLYAGRQIDGKALKPPPFEAGQELTPEQAKALLESKPVPWPRFVGVLPDLISEDVASESRPETDVPSGTGFWSYARACFIGHGHYFVFAEQHDEFLDRCVRAPGDDSLRPPLDRSAKVQWEATAAVPTVKRLRELVATALEATRDWCDVVGPLRPSGSAPNRSLLRPIDVFESPGVRRTTLTDLAFDQRNRDLWKEFSKSLPAPIAACDRAAIELSSLLDIDVRSWESLEARARYDALIERFWLKMSAFHLESLRVLTSDPERFLIDPKKGWSHPVTSYEAIRLSDCLEASEGRQISPELERRSESYRRRLVDSGCLWQIDQCNVLFTVWGWDPARPLPQIVADPVCSPFDPNYRAQRDVLEPVANLDDSLKTRALDLIETAREIHEECRDTPWDWLVYYASIDVYGFVKDPILPGSSSPPRPDQKPTKTGQPTPKSPQPGSTSGSKPGTTGNGGN